MSQIASLCYGFMAVDIGQQTPNFLQLLTGDDPMTRFVIKNGDLDMSLILEMKPQARLQEAVPCPNAGTGCDKPWLCDARHEGCGRLLNSALASILNLEEKIDPGPHRIN